MRPDDTLPPESLQRIRNRMAIHDMTYTSAGDLRKGITPTQDVTQTPARAILSSASIR